MLQLILHLILLVLVVLMVGNVVLAFFPPLALPSRRRLLL